MKRENGLTITRNANLIARYKDGAEIEALCLETGLEVATVYRILKKAGVPLRGRRYASKPRERAARLLHKSGWSVDTISAALQTTTGDVRYMLDGTLPIED